MFRQMALDVENSVATAHLQHTQRFQDCDNDNDNDNDGLTNVFQLTQAGQRPADDKLDYSLVSTCIISPPHPINICLF